jgi:hypothetical protein
VAEKGAVVLMLSALGCSHAELSEIKGEFLGDWQLVGGDKERDCGSGAQTIRYSNVHQIRFVEGTTSDLALQFFDGADTTGPVVCEFAFDTGDRHALLAEEHSCADGELVATWHSSRAWFPEWGIELAFETAISDTMGCSGTLRPWYDRVR